MNAILLAHGCGERSQWLKIYGDEYISQQKKSARGRFE